MVLTRDTPTPRPRRVYTAVVAVEQSDGFAVALDGRTARTPAGGGLILPTRRLAEAIAAEWATQPETIDIAAMPLTRLAFTALDRAASAHEAMVLSLARSAEADALCYFAEAPQDLHARQDAQWSPVLDWAAQALGLNFVRTTGILHAPQPVETVARVADLARPLDRFGLTGLAFAAALFQSVVLALAVERQRLGGLEALELSRLDEAYQEERWGVDDEAAARTAGLRRDALAVEDWFGGLGVN
jgi:chaperone required for assembly of F1-ATPase